eukprot:CAMPEP_0119109500 /NCGR_PEP_ID=MMETSP1180-20130426/18874_1 /TAXON_ID=3052 ORGANISM="Chlamydomonas cf sp, Strain CCMP681" /NCGR_SAMPLE_ID=MMETSP1180 /ASSEMBLY_ACC=CAM_ASM_000741 /LENGTH=147 /DNA_ID=CAMNT_0007095283 /DNA_START=50 /DNA_END=493 /DNA_ORIENTATION=+
MGALVGPPWSKRQNGIVFREILPPSSPQPGTSVYFEPHCDFDTASVTSVAPVDVVISPTKTASVGVGVLSYPLTMGSINLQKLLRILKPKVLIPLLNSEIEHSGALAAILTETGDYAALQEELKRVGLTDIRVEWPAPPGESMAIAL